MVLHVATCMSTKLIQCSYMYNVMYSYHRYQVLVISNEPVLLDVQSRISQQSIFKHHWFCSYSLCGLQ